METGTLFALANARINIREGLALDATQLEAFAAYSEHITLSTDSEGLVQINNTCAVFSGFAPFTERTKYGADASGMCQEPGCIEPCYEGSSRCKSPRCSGG